MSPQATAKAAQGWKCRPVHPTCATCQHLTFDTITIKGCTRDFTEPINERCTLGNFATRTRATCNQHTPK